MTHYPIRDRRHLLLDGIWDFTYCGDIDINTIDTAAVRYDEAAAVPGVFDTAITRPGVRGVGIYRTRVQFPVRGPIRLSFGGMGLFARIWWDGRHVADCRSPYGPVSYDLTVTADCHELVIAVDNRFGPQTPLFQPFWDFYGYGGIYRSVTVTELPARRIERAHIETVDIHTGAVRIRIRTAGMPGDEDIAVAFDGGAAKQFRASPVNDVFTIETQVPDHKTWSPAAPHLHTATITIGSDSITERFGIRTIETRGRQILLNGKPIFLKGVNRHAAHPELGPVEPLHIIADDLALARDLGCNFIRTVHYPQHQSLLDLCDVMGFLVWEESIGWQVNAASAADARTAELLTDQTRSMVRESINHPSIIFWGFLNESCSDKPEGRSLYGALAQMIRAEDGTRLVSFASDKIERDISFEHADVISINMYPGWISPSNDWTTATCDMIRPAVEARAAYFSEGKFEKPLLVTEIGACALYGCHDRANAQWSEEFQSLYMGTACRAIMDNARYAGVALWQLFDTRSFVNAGQVRTKPRGFNCAGLLDEYRRPKLAYDTVKGLFRNACEAR